MLSRHTRDYNIKEGEKRDKYLDLARELKRLWNMIVTVIPIPKERFPKNL